MYGQFYNYPGQAPPQINMQPPFNIPLPNGVMNPGQMIFIRGHPKGGERFAINIGCNADIDGDNIPFHFNPRFADNVVVRNTKVNGSWGNEERHGGFPFRHHEHFEMIITCLPDKYQVFVNGQHFIDYAHRTSYNEAYYFGIKGDVSIDSVHFQGGMVLGQYTRGYAVQPPPAPFVNPAVPCDFNVPGGIGPGKLFVISGTVLYGNEGRFSVNLQQGYDAENIGLHFDVRMNYGSCQRVIVRNSKTHGSWGSEERQAPYFPFEYNAPFRVFIYCDTDHFKVAVNDQHFLEYPYRLSIHHLDTLNITGDVQLHEVRIQ